MSPDGLVSTIIPVHNRPRLLGEAVASVLAQTYRRIEIIVVDDGSTDKTYENALAAGVVALRHPLNRGYGRSLMTAFAKAQYDWILMIDADGSYPPEEAEKRYMESGLVHHRKSLAYTGRDLSKQMVANLVGSPDLIKEKVAGLKAIGVDHACALMIPADSMAEFEDQVEWFAKTVL